MLAQYRRTEWLKNEPNISGYKYPTYIPDSYWLLKSVYHIGDEFRKVRRMAHIDHIESRLSQEVSVTVKEVHICCRLFRVQVNPIMAVLDFVSRAQVVALVSLIHPVTQTSFWIPFILCEAKILKYTGVICRLKCWASVQMVRSLYHVYMCLLC